VIPSFVARFPPDLLDSAERCVLLYRHVLTIDDRAVLAEFKEVTGGIRSVVQRYCRTLGVGVLDFDEEKVTNRAFDKIQTWQSKNLFGGLPETSSDNRKAPVSVL
jgi:hypothetical protein